MIAIRMVSENFEKMYRLLTDDRNSYQQINELFKKGLSCVADEIHLGKVEISLDVTPSLSSPRGYHDNFSFQHPEYSSNPDQICSYERMTREGGKARMYAYPLEGYRWDEEEEKQIRFLLDVCFTLVGRSRLLSLVERAALTDNITAAYNLIGLHKFAGELFAKGKLADYVGIFMNLRNFKFINQSVGSRKGDEILRKYHFAVAGFLTNEEIFARPGGDNFVILVKRERVIDLLDFLSDITISVSVGEETKKFEIGARMGLHDIQPGEPMGQVLDFANAALNVARQSQKQSYIWFEKRMLENALHEKEVANAFPLAMKNEEFVVYYQPKVVLEDKTLHGAEALVRWVRDGRVIPPNEFIPVLEKDGSVCELDFYMFSKVCEDITEWLAQGIEPVRVSVNFSRLHLLNPNFIEGLITIMQAYDVDGKYLEIELTETSSYEDFDRLVEVVEHLKEFDVATAIDDFGSGYSSLGLLKDLDVDVIKLDKTFMDNLENDDQTDRIIIKNVVNMIRELHKEALAEGVETEKQAEFLKSIQCPVVQGFLFDKPLTKEDFEKRLIEAGSYYAE